MDIVQIGLEIQAEITKYRFMSPHRNGRTNNFMAANKHLKNMAKLKYLLITITNRNFIHETIYCKLNSGDS
jgi:hypothetical protein